MKQARGMRNNNPLNIIKSEKINWQGEAKPSTDPNFAQFETLEYGLRAAFKLLQTYYTKHGCKTITYQGSESAYGDCPRRSTASDETGDAGALVRHRAGDGDGGVRTEWQGTAGTGAVCRSWVDTEEVRKASPQPLSKRRGAFC